MLVKMPVVGVLGVSVSLGLVVGLGRVLAKYMQIASRSSVYMLGVDPLLVCWGPGSASLVSLSALCGA